MSSAHTHGSLSSTSTHNSISFLRVPPKSGKAKTEGKKKRESGQGEKEEWYIPYKGPYEPAPGTGLKKRESRDSWGDPVPGMESGVGDGVDSYQGDQHHLHVHAPNTAQGPQQQRPRSQSHASNQNQPNQPLSLRPDYSSPKITSYISLDTAGGVGGSPVPPPSSSRHMLHAGYGTGRFNGGGGGGGVGGDGMGRPWSAREARGGEGNEGAGTPRTLKQRSSLASLFEKKYSQLKKWSKLGLGTEGVAKEEKGPPRIAVEDSGDPGQSAEKRPRQRPQPQHQHPTLSPSPDPGSRTRSPASHLRINVINPAPSSSVTAAGDDHDDDRRDGGDITVVPRSPPSETETGSVSVYSQPSPFVPLTQPRSVQPQEGPKDKEWVPIVRLTPPPVLDQDNPPLTASTASAGSVSHSNSPSRSRSHSHSNSQSPSHNSASAPAPLGIVEEDDGHVDSYYDMLITSSVPSTPPLIESRTTAVDERHPYAYTFPSGHIDRPSDLDPVYPQRFLGMQKTRLSPIPQSRPSLTLRSVASSPDLGERGKARFGQSDDVHAQRMEEGVDVSRLRPHVREKLASTGTRGKERWLSTDLIAIFLPKPKFKIKAKIKTTKKSHSSTDLPSSVGHQGAPPSNVVPIVAHNMAEFGVVQRLSDVQEEPRRSTSRRKSYAYDDLSLLSLDRVLEERDKLEKDRIKWQAQAVKSLGNKHTRIVSRSRSKSLTQAGRKMKSIPGQQQQQHRHHHTRGQQSSIDYLAARACLGDQDMIPVVDEDNAVVIDIGPTPATVRRPQFAFPRHERMPSGSSGLATSSGGRRSSNGLSARSGSASADNANGHKRNDSWSRSAVRIAKSLPQLCGVVKDDDEDHEDQNNNNNNKRIQHQPQPQQDPAPVTLLTPIVNENRKPSPSPSNTSGGGGGVLVGIAISTPPDSRDYHHHPYTIGADRDVDDIDSKRKGDDEVDESGRSPPDIRLPDHPYAQGGLSSSSISRCIAGEREPDYVGPHPAVAVAMTKELMMANLGMSELSARHRLPPQVILAHHPPPPPPIIRLESGSQTLPPQPQPPLLQAQQQQQQQPQNQKSSSNHLYVKVDDPRNSYQDLQPYVRVDSDARPSDRLWVTYSPGTVREVMPNEVFQYSPRVSDQDVNNQVAASGPDPVSASSDGAGTDFFLQRYQRMSTVYQDTATMSQALGNAMYDSSSTQDARRRRRDSGEHQQSTTTTTATTSRELVTTTAHPDVVVDPPESTDTDTSTSQEHQLLASRYTATPPPRVLFGPRLNTTPPKYTTESASRVSSPILPRPSPSIDNHHSAYVVFTDPFPGRGAGGGAISAASPEHSSSGISTSPPTSPTVPRVDSPDNLEPFHGLFYRPPGGSETDSPVQSPSPRLLARVPDPEDEEEEPSHLLLDDPQWIPRLGGSGLTTLMKEVNDELEQMVLERQREEQQRERSGSIRSSSTQQSQRPSTSDSVSTSTTSKGGGGGGGGGGVRRSRRINTEAGPLDFVLDRTKQDPSTTQSGYVPRPNRISTFYPSTPIPEDIEFSRASSPFEGTVEDDTVRLPVGSNNNANQTGPPPTTTTTTSTRPSTYPTTEEEFLSMYYPDGMRASYLTTTDTLSRISTLSEFPVPPNGMTPEEISILTAQPR